MSSKTAEQWASEVVSVVKVNRPSLFAGQDMWAVNIGNGEQALPVGPEVALKEDAESLRKLFISAIEPTFEQLIESIGFDKGGIVACIRLAQKLSGTQSMNARFGLTEDGTIYVGLFDGSAHGSNPSRWVGEAASGDEQEAIRNLFEKLTSEVKREYEKHLKLAQQCGVVPLSEVTATV